MAKRGDVELLIAYCQHLGGSWGTQDAIVCRMKHYHRWKPERALSAIQRALDDRLLRTGKGGTIKFGGTDRAIYDDVGRRLQCTWAPRQGFRNCSVCNTSAFRSARGSGDWVCPDLVLLADPKRRRTSDAPLEVHTIEVEHERGFGIESVYQSYEQGRGADYSWVFFLRLAEACGADWEIAMKSWVLPPLKDEPTKPFALRWKRIRRAADELGVGLVWMKVSHIVGDWTVLSRPKRRIAPDAIDRALLFQATGLTVAQLQNR